MIGPITFIRTLEARGVILRASGPNLDQLQVSFNKGDISRREKKLIEKYRPEILHILRVREVYKFLADNINSIIQGDSAEVLKKFPVNSFDQLVIDPNYGIGFMGKYWDKSVPEIKLFEQCLRVLKPGAFAFFMCSPRQDVLAQMVINLKKAGFLVNFPSIYWTYASGFPKIHNISKTVDKKNGTKGKALKGSYAGFQPKPAIEVILVVMKPLAEKSYTEQAMANGKGCTWLDDCRIPYADENIPSRDLIKQKSSTSNQVIASQGDEWHGNQVGRMPANLLVSDNVLDNGDYSRFFSLDAWAERNLPFLIVSKASRQEKDYGLMDFETKKYNTGKTKITGHHAQWGNSLRKNIHPTVKPVKLMAYLISMGSRPGDLIGDFAAGSGTTCVAAKLLGRKFIGIEKEVEYHRIAVARVEHASLDEPVLNRAVADIKKHEESREQQEDDGPAKAPEPCFFSNMSKEQLKELDEEE